MNFFGHVCIATHFTADESVGLGAMLPDLANLLGLRNLRTRHAGIERGCNLHRRTDSVFHDLAAFRRECRCVAQQFRCVGFERGQAVAVAHIGIEFLLDDALAEDHTSQSLYERSLTAAAPDKLASHIPFPNSGIARQFEALRVRLLAASDLTSPIAPELVAERIFRTLHKRPKLAIRSEQMPTIAEWARQTQEQGLGLFRALVTDVVAKLEAEVTDRVTRSADPLRFRRARSVKL